MRNRHKLLQKTKKLPLCRNSHGADVEKPWLGSPLTRGVCGNGVAALLWRLWQRYREPIPEAFEENVKGTVLADLVSHPVVRSRDQGT